VTSAEDAEHAYDRARSGILSARACLDDNLLDAGVVRFPPPEEGGDV
jgi:hypothetical protein